MASRATQRAASVGVAENSNTAVLVTVSPGGTLLDRRRVELTSGLSTHPHHHEGSQAVGRYPNTHGVRKMSLDDAVILVEKVRKAAERGAREALDDLAASVPAPITSIAIRAFARLPPTIEERITDNRAQSFADSAMYREALAIAAEARGWSVHWYDRDGVFQDAAAVLDREDITSVLREMGRAIGPPWQAPHKLAAAAAIVATGPPEPPRRTAAGRR